MWGDLETMKVPGNNRSARYQCIVSGGVNPAPNTVLDNRVFVDEHRPARLPLWEVVFQVNPVDVRILRRESCQPSLKSPVMVSTRPNEARLRRHFLYLGKHRLQVIDLV